MFHLILPGLSDWPASRPGRQQTAAAEAARAAGGRAGLSGARPG